jgi:hypothetical protein
MMQLHISRMSFSPFPALPSLTRFLVFREEVKRAAYAGIVFDH